jgi:DNA-binding transcriptional MocR family regulator
VTELKQYRIRGSSAAELVRSVEAGVAAGALAPGERLPSVRSLAREVGLSAVTVSSALAELRRRGVIVSEERRATRIGEGPPIGAVRALMPVPRGARDLSRGNPDPELLPDLARAVRALTVPARLYGEPAAMPELIALARQRLRAARIPAESLCVVSGALDGIERVLAVHLRPGDRVAVENPGYAALYDLVRAHGLRMEPVAVDERGMIPAELARAIERGVHAVVITPRGQNPTGAALDAARARALRKVLAAAPAVLVIEDDHLGDAAGVPLHTTLPARGAWAATRSVAKELGPDIRLAILAADARTIALVEGAQRCGPGWVSHLLQALVAALWGDPEVQRSGARAAAAYAQRRERVLECLRERGVVAHGACGLNVWVPVADESFVVGAMLQRGWVLAPGDPYRLPGSAPAVRITIATLSREDAQRLAGDLAAVLAPGRSARAG